MRMLMTVTAAAIAATAMISTASAEGTISCDSSLPDGGVQADSCDVWNGAASIAPQAYAAVPMHHHMALAPYQARRHSNKTDVHGGAGN